MNISTNTQKEYVNRFSLSHFRFVLYKLTLSFWTQWEEKVKNHIAIVHLSVSIKTHTHFNMICMWSTENIRFGRIKFKVIAYDSVARLQYWKHGQVFGFMAPSLSPQIHTYSNISAHFVELSLICSSIVFLTCVRKFHTKSRFYSY